MFAARLPQALRSLLATAFCMTATSCGDAAVPAAAGWAGSVDTLANGRVVVRNRAPILGSAEAWTATESFRLGSLSDDGPELFGQIYDLEWGPDGSLYVLDNQANEVRIFGADGAFLRSFGREGQGPGEFNVPLGMDFGPDGLLWVMSRANARFSGFDPATGELVEERPRVAGFVIIPWRGGFDREGRFYDVGLASDGETALLGLDADFRPADTLRLPVLDPSRMIAFRSDGQMVMSMRDPFASAPQWAVHTSGGMVYGEGDSYRIHRVGFGGDTLSTIELDREPIPVTSAEADSALQAFEERLEELEAVSRMTPDRDPQVPDFKPAHGPLFMDDLGRLWVRRVVEEPGASWDIFAEDGRYLTRLTIPVRPAFVFPAVSEARIAIAADVDGIPSIVVYDVTGSAGG